MEPEREIWRPHKTNSNTPSRAHNFDGQSEISTRTRNSREPVSRPSPRNYKMRGIVRDIAGNDDITFATEALDYNDNRILKMESRTVSKEIRSG